MNLDKLFSKLKGSSGSGNWAHSGRPGKRGGSSAGGGLVSIGAKPDSSVAERRKKSKTKRESDKKFANGEKLFKKVQFGGTLKLTSDDLDVDVSIKTFAGAYGMAVKRPDNKKFGKHPIRSTNYIKNYLGQFNQRTD